MRAITILLAALALASCDDNNNNNNHNHKNPGISFEPLLSPSPVITALLAPRQLPIVTIPTISCPVIGAFTTAFDLVILPAGPRDLFLDRAAFRLLDGSNIGGPVITIPRPELNSMFGSTQVFANRAFAFRPQFGCEAFRPFSLVAEIRLVDRFGAGSSVTVTAGF